jgi:hypothetical protein
LTDVSCQQPITYPGPADLLRSGTELVERQDLSALGALGLGAGLGILDGDRLVHDRAAAGEEVGQGQSAGLRVGAVVLRLPHRGFHHRAGVPGALGGLAVGLVFGAPVDVGLVDRFAGVGVDQHGVLGHQHRTVRRVGDRRLGGFLPVGGAQVAQRHRSGVAPRRALRQDGESLIGIGGFGLGAGRGGDAVLAQLCDPVLERRLSGHRQQRLHRIVVAVDYVDKSSCQPCGVGERPQRRFRHGGDLSRFVGVGRPFLLPSGKIDFDRKRTAERKFSGPGFSSE